MATTFDWEKVMTKYFDPKATDNFFRTNTLLEYFRKFSKKRNFGNTWRETLETTEGIADNYAELEILDRSRKNIVHYADYESGKFYAAMNVSWDDEKRSRSPEEKVDLMNMRAKNAVKSMQRKLTASIRQGDGTGRDMVGLGTMISEAGTTAAGGINGATAGYTYWVNKTTAVGGTLTLTDLIEEQAACSNGGKTTDSLLTDKYIQAYIWGNLLQAQERYTTGKFNMAEELPMVIGIPIITDAAFEGSINTTDSVYTYDGGFTGGNIYFHDKDGLFLAINSQDDMKRWPTMMPVDQFVYSTKWTFEGMLVMNQRRTQGLLYNITV